MQTLRARFSAEMIVAAGVVILGAAIVIILGEGCSSFSRNRPDNLRVFLYARENKVRRLQGRGKTEKEAEELVDSVDRETSDFIQKYFNLEWPERAIYHTMMNTAIGDEAIVGYDSQFQANLRGKRCRMTTLQEFRCEICGRVANSPNHWFVIQCSDAELGVLKWNPKAASAPGARHFCGEAHSQVYISRWFESICSPPKPDFIASPSPKS